MPTFSILEENQRQAKYGDGNFKKKGLYMFVLRGPPNEGPIPATGIAQFPLVINPDLFEYDLPFAAELTPLQEGGVIAEENGIVIGRIVISGTTGFTVRSALTETSTGRSSGTFTGALDQGGASGVPLTGHMHFWRLANRCFEGYSDFKKNPRFASKTVMELHVSKDDLHLLVVPEKFKLTRSAASERVTYRYEIELAVVGAASKVVVPSPDKAWQDKFKDAIANVREGVQSAQAAANDLTAVVDSVQRTLKGAVAVIDDVASVLDACNNFLDGVKRFIDIPIATVIATTNALDSLAAVSANSSDIPVDVRIAFDQLSDAMDQLAAAGKLHFKPQSFNQRIDDYERLTEGYRTGSDDVRDGAVTNRKAKADAGGGTLTYSQAFAGGVAPGDELRGQFAGRKSARFDPNQFRGVAQYIVTHGDTLHSLAAKYMGSPDLAPAIIFANQLRPPYITFGARMEGTLRPGDGVLIPIPETLVNPDTLTNSSTNVDDAFGVDFERVRLANGRYGWAIDTAHGSTDVRKIRGVANLSQGLSGRVRTQQAENVLYPAFGLSRTVGEKNDLNALAIRFEIRQQVLADPRIASISRIELTSIEDQSVISVDAVPVGYTSTKSLTIT